MKRFFLLSTIIISSFGIMNAQAGQNTNPQVRAKGMVVKVNNVAPLQGAQFAQVNDAFVAYFTKHDALDAQKATLSKADYDKQLAELKATRDKAIKASLTPAQLTQWTAVVEKDKLD